MEHGCCLKGHSLNIIRLIYILTVSSRIFFSNLPLIILDLFIQPRGSSFQDAKLQFADVQLALKEASGTVVFNSAGTGRRKDSSEGKS